MTCPYLRAPPLLLRAIATLHMSGHYSSQSVWAYLYWVSCYHAVQHSIHHPCSQHLKTFLCWDWHRFGGIRSSSCSIVFKPRHPPDYVGIAAGNHRSRTPNCRA